MLNYDFRELLSRKPLITALSFMADNLSNMQTRLYQFTDPAYFGKFGCDVFLEIVCTYLPGSEISHKCELGIKILRPLLEYYGLIPTIQNAHSKDKLSGGIHLHFPETQEDILKRGSHITAQLLQTLEHAMLVSKLATAYEPDEGNRPAILEASRPLLIQLKYFEIGHTYVDEAARINWRAPIQKLPLEVRIGGFGFASEDFGQDIAWTNAGSDSEKILHELQIMGIKAEPGHYQGFDSAGQLYLKISAPDSQQKLLELCDSYRGAAYGAYRNP